MTAGHSTSTDPDPEFVARLAKAIRHRDETMEAAALRALTYAPVVEQLQGLPPRMATIRGRAQTAMGLEDPEPFHMLVLALQPLIRARDACCLTLREAGWRDTQIGELADLRPGQVNAAVERADSARSARRRAE